MKTYFKVFAVMALSTALKGQISILTNIPPKIAPNSTLNIEVKIIKGAVANFSKYQIDVPAGITVSEGSSKTGNFTFEAGRAKIVWVSIPFEPEFIISFVMNIGAMAGNGVFNQRFFYLDNGSKQELEIDPINVEFDPSGANATVPLPPVEGVAANNSNAPSNTSNPPAVETNTTPPVAVETKTQAPVSNPPANDNPPVKTEPIVKNEPPANTSQGLVYKVQLGAYGADPGKSRFKAAGNVSISKEEGLYKVVTGNFKTKEEALKRREELISKGLTGFVVSYQNGVRVK